MDEKHVLCLMGLGVTSVIFQPLEVIKNRMQVRNVGLSGKKFKTSTEILSEIIKKEGIQGIYRGGSALIVKTVLSTTPNHLITYHMISANSEPCISQYLKYFSTGFCVAFLATPAEVALVRMSVDSGFPNSMRRNYRNVFDAWYRIVTQEGILTLWRGATPSMGVTGLTIAVYTTRSAYGILGPEEYVSLRLKNETLKDVARIAIPGVFSTFVSLPIDLAKTRLQNMKTINGIPEYTGAWHVIKETSIKEGYIALWKGFFPYYFRIFPYTIYAMYVINKICQY